jgi:hypothetical protein
MVTDWLIVACGTTTRILNDEGFRECDKRTQRPRLRAVRTFLR